MERMTHLASLNAAFHRSMEKDRSMLVLGEDILDPYGGAFKATQGLSTKFPDRVWTTPISEAVLVGMAGGLAMRGFKPVVEIMFGDFLTLAADQIINHLAKYPGIYGMRTRLPVVVRTPMGGGRGYGATHSQSLEKHFLGLPYMTLISPSLFHDTGALFEAVLEHSRFLTVFIEHKKLYGMPLGGERNDWRVESLDSGPFPALSIKKKSAGRPEVALISYGGQSILLEQALAKLEEEEIAAEALIPCQLSPMRLEAVANRVQEIGRAVIVEEGIEDFGWGSHVIAHLHQTARQPLRLAHVGARASVIPCPQTLENEMLPNMERLLAGVKEVLKY